MTQKRTLTERQFIEVENDRKRELSELIKRSNLTYSYIAAQTGVERRAVKRAVQCEGIHFYTAVRLEFFLEWFINEQQTNRSNNDEKRNG